MFTTGKAVAEDEENILSVEICSKIAVENRGNGMHELSDSDLMLDGRGLPFIPGTSLAGIIRHRVGSICSDKETLKSGCSANIEKAGEGVEETSNTSSAIIIGDAVDQSRRCR